MVSFDFRQFSALPAAKGACLLRLLAFENSRFQGSLYRVSSYERPDYDLPYGAPLDPIGPHRCIHRAEQETTYLFFFYPEKYERERDAGGSEEGGRSPKPKPQMSVSRVE